MAKTKKRVNAKVASKSKSKAANRSWLSRVGSAIKGRPKTALLVAVLVAVLLVAMVPRVQQSFASGCSGSKIDVYSIRKPSTGSYAGYLNLYWNGSKNCAIAYAGGVTSGDRMYREVCIRADGENRHCDRGNFISYAGPVWTGYSKGDCLDLFAYFANSDGAPAQGWLLKYNVHCG